MTAHARDHADLVSAKAVAIASGHAILDIVRAGRPVAAIE
jgi:hypothetical protein